MHRNWDQSNQILTEILEEVIMMVKKSCIWLLSFAGIIIAFTVASWASADDVVVGVNVVTIGQLSEQQ
jgi:hypothetical protein